MERKIETFQTSWVSRCVLCREQGEPNKAERTDRFTVWDDDELVIDEKMICVAHQEELRRRGLVLE